MAIVVVGGSGKDVGKTSLMCAVIAALPEFAWTAVKITAHDYEPAARDAGAIHQTIWEETAAGEETDTGRYLAAGARRALLVRRRDRHVPIEEIKKALGKDSNVIFESNRIVDAVRADVCLALLGASATKPSFKRLLAKADAVVSIRETCVGLRPGTRCFRLDSVEPLPGEMVKWMRERLRKSDG